MQKEQMVLQYVKKHWSISRREVAGLCRIVGPQAYRLLQRLVRKGVINQSARRGRSVRYEAKAH